MPSVLEYHHSADSGLFPRSYRVPDERVAAVRSAADRPLATEVLEALREQNRGATALQFLDGRPVAFVVTGQQLGLFGGPLFTFYKIASAIRLARSLQEESGICVLPLFWLQSEDHDYEEIRSASFFARDGSVASIALPETLPGVGDSVGSILIPEDVAHSLKKFLEDTFGDRVPRERIETLASFYRKGNSLSAALSELVRHCFQASDLLVLDAHTTTLKRYAGNFLTRFFVEQDQIEELLNTNARRLSNSQLDLTIPIRPGFPLPFLRVGTRRERIQKVSDNSYKTSQGILSKADLLKLLEEHPAYCTSSALARPLFQDFLLPSAAYVAGPSEFNYWAQLPELYQHFSIPMPLVVPRARFAVLPENRLRILDDEKLSLNEAHRPVSELIATRLQSTSADPERTFAPALASLGSIESILTQQFSSLNDKGLSESIGVTIQSMRHNLDKLKSKYVRVLAQRHDTFKGRVEKLQSLLLPQGEPQERTICFSHYYLLEGPAFTDQVMSALRFPFARDIQLLSVAAEGRLNQGGNDS